MAFATQVNISRRLPVINGFVSIPDGQAFRRTSLTPSIVIGLIPGSRLFRLGKDGKEISMPTVQKLVVRDKNNYQMWIVLPDFDRLEGPPEDWFELLRDAADLL